MSDSIDPPHSRLFVLCGKSATSDIIKKGFEKFGTIEDIWIVKDKATGERKGVAYVKFAKTSSAALAVEEMNGQTLDGNPKVLKVMVAHSRDQGSKREDDIERLIRLFIVISKTTTEEELRSHFEQYGRVDSVSIVKNRETGENKGFAYIKFTRPYSAAKAYEQCPKSYKAVFAKPKDHKSSMNQFMTPFDRFNTSESGLNWSDNRSDHGPTRLFALVAPMLREQLVYRLFDLIPGLQICRFIHDPRVQYNMGPQKVLVQYSSNQAAQHALEKMNLVEYPVGHRITVKPVDNYHYPMGGGNYHDGVGGRGQREDFTTISNSELTTLTNALAKAESIIKSAGLTGGAGSIENNDNSYCSVPLPPPQPSVIRNTDESPSERLFIVCQPGLPPMYALRDVFGRFGDLLEVYVINGKNCGYVSYASKEAAEKAIETLHLQEICGMRIKVMKAEPPKGGPNNRKRVRVETEDN